jgi:dipeptidase D
VEARVSALEAVLQKEQRLEDPNLSLSVRRAEATGAPLTSESTTRVISLLHALPHGVFRMSDDIEGLVETSSNVATVKLDEKTFSVLVSQRSSVPSQLDAVSEKINAVVALAGGSVKYESEYPAWTPNMESKLLATAQEVYREVTGDEPAVEAIHAGLEAGVIGAKHEGMDMISLGPTIEGAHSPDERLYIPSLENVRRVLGALLASLVYTP